MKYGIMRKILFFALITAAAMLWIPLSVQAGYDDNESWGRDPFAGQEPMVQIETSSYRPEPTYWLSGIFSRGMTRIAIINRRFLKTGEEVAGARVTRISDDRVILKKGEEEITVLLGARS